MVNIKLLDQVLFENLPLDNMAEVLKIPEPKVGETVKLNRLLLDSYDLSQLNVMFDGLMLSPRGVFTTDGEFSGLNLCHSCIKDIDRCVVSQKFIAARNFIGNLPDEFADTNRTEHALINPAQSSVFLSTIHGSGSASVLKSHAYLMRAAPQPLACQLPRKIFELETIQVTIASSLTPPQKAKVARSYNARPNRLASQTDWYKKNNKRYSRFPKGHFLTLEEDDFVLPLRTTDANFSVDGTRHCEPGYLQLLIL